VDISLNGTLITASTNTYSYRVLLETLLSYGEDAKKTQLASAVPYFTKIRPVEWTLWILPPML